MDKNNFTRVELPEVTLPSGKTVNFRLPSKLERRFVSHIKTDEYLKDDVILEEFLCLLCLTKINGAPINLGNAGGFLSRFVEGSGIGGSRLSPQQKSSVCDELFQMIVELFENDPRDWDTCVSIWAGAGGIGSKEDAAFIEEQIKNLLAVKADTTVKTRESSEPQGPNVRMLQ